MSFQPVSAWQSRAPQTQSIPSNNVSSSSSTSTSAINTAHASAGAVANHAATSGVDIEGSPFAALGLATPFVRALHAEGYSRPTPIQEQAIPHLLRGRDVLGCAQTGTGKTAAFLLPILQNLSKSDARGRIRALVLTPTRELASQIDERAGAYGRHVGVRHAVIFGGVSQRPQENALRRGIDLLIATPGRLLDLMNQGYVRLDSVEHFVLDEADRMLDMGFVHDVKRIVSALPRERQNLLFSATMPRSIESLANAILRDPARVAVAPPATTVELVAQRMYFVAKERKRALLEHVLRGEGVSRTLVFTRTKHGADRVCKQLAQSGIVAAAIHGNKSQNARERALESFRRGSIGVLVATDIAARGIDVDAVSHVVNYDLPDVPEAYVHRIGRTGRAGASGQAISFCQPDEKSTLRDIERVIKRAIPVATDDVSAASHAAPAPWPQADLAPRHDGAPPAQHAQHVLSEATANGNDAQPQASNAFRSQRPRRYRGSRRY